MFTAPFGPILVTLFNGVYGNKFQCVNYPSLGKYKVLREVEGAITTIPPLRGVIVYKIMR